MAEINPVALRKLLAELFSIDELCTLCFDLGEDKETFAGQFGKAELSVKIIEHFRNRDRLPDLLDQVEHERPGFYQKYLSVELDLEHDRSRQADQDRRRREKKFERVVNPPPMSVRETFKDRAREMKELCDHLADSGVRLISVVGRGGIGKTALVSKVFAEIERGEWPVPCPGGEGLPCILYLGAKTTGLTLERLYADVARLLGPDAAKELTEFYKQPGPLADKAHFLLSRLRDGLYLVVMDNLESVLQPDGTIADEGLRVFVEACFAAEHGARLVITSREDIPISAAALARVRWVRLDHGLPEDDAVAMLRQLDPDGAGGLRDADDALLREAVRKVHGVPYALERIAGILRATPDLSLERLLRASGLFTGQVIENLAEYCYTRLGENARRVMESLSVLDRPVTETAVRYLLLPFAPDVDVASELRALVRDTFVTANRVTGTFALHPLDREAAYERLQAVPHQLSAPVNSATYNAQSLELRAADYYANLRKDKSEWLDLKDLEPPLFEIEHCLRAGSYDRAVLLMDQLDREYLQLWGAYSLALGIRRRLRGNLHDDRLSANNWKGLGEVYRVLSEPEQAIECDKQALSIAQKLNDPRMERILLDNMGYDHFMIGDIDTAISFSKRALEIQQSIGLGAGTAETLKNLGQYYSTLGQLAASTECFEQALSLATRFNNLRLTEGCLGGLGQIREILDETEQAVAFLGQALDTAKRIKDRRGECRWLAYLGRCYAETDQYRLSTEYGRQALELGLQIGDKGAASTAFYVLGTAEYRLGDLGSANTYFLESCNLHEPTVEPLSALWLGMTKLRLSNLVDAKSWFDVSIARSSELLDKSPGRVAFLLIYGTALLCARVVSQEWSSASGQQRIALLQPVLHSYNKALAISVHPRLVRQMLYCLRSLQNMPVENIDLAIELLENTRRVS